MANNVLPRLFLRVRAYANITLLISLLITVSPESAAEADRDLLLKEHRFGRFAISLPDSFVLLSATVEQRFAKLKTIDLPQGQGHANAVESAWQARLKEISQLTPPRATWVDDIIIEQRQLQTELHPVLAVCYYGNSIDPESINWDAFFDYGGSGLWVSVEGYYLYDERDAEGIADEMDFPRLERFKERLVNDFMEIGEAYHPETDIGKQSERNWFYLTHGAIALPYLEQEEEHLRLEDSQHGLKLSIETESVDEVEKTGLIDRLGAVMLSTYPLGFDVSIDRIHTGKRKVAGLKGDEAIFRMKDKKREEVAFSWEFPGIEDSGDSPNIIIMMETKNRDIDRNTKLWGAIMDSMRPTGR